MNKLRLLKLTLLLLLVMNGNAQPHYFRHYQVENGLSNNTVNCSIQDKSGFLWFGTKEGLNRFDGTHFKLFHIEYDGEKRFSNDYIFCLFIDAQGTMWIGSEQGLYKFNAQKEKLERIGAPLANISAIQMDLKGKLWFISAGRVNIYDTSSHKIKTFTDEQKFEATSLCMLTDGSIWFSAQDGYLQYFQTTTQHFIGYNMFAHSPGPASQSIRKIYPGPEGKIFVGTSNQGIKEFNIPDKSYRDLLILNPDQTTIYVRDILQFSATEYWFATESGIFILDIPTGKFINLKKQFTDPYSLSDNAIYTLCRDREGGIWAGTYFGGVNYYSRQYAAFQKYFPDNSENSISGSAVREICQDKYGNIWIGTEDAGLNKLNRKTRKMESFQPTGSNTSIAYSNIHGLLASGDDLWIGTFDHGLDVLDIRTGKVKKRYSAGPGEHELKSNFIVTMLEATDGTIYIGTGSFLYTYNKRTDSFDQVGEVPSYIFVSSIIEDHNHTIWVATHSNGVFYFNRITGQKGVFGNHPGDDNSLTNNAINALLEDSEHNIWVSSEGGGACVIDAKREKVTRYTILNGLPSNFVFKILEDKRKDIWITTSKGLVNLEKKTNKITIYTKANGLLNDQFNYNSGFIDEDGRLYFGSVKGMITLSPDELRQANYAPPVFITGFQVHNDELENSSDSLALKKSILFTDEISLPYDKSSFSIDFAALSYTAPELMRYKYKMDGLDKEWTNLQTNRKVYFTNLSPGNYTFRVMAGYNDRWGFTERTLMVTIRPPFWATIWAYLLYAAIILSLVIYLARLYHQRTQDKKEKEIYKAKIDFFTNVAHEIRTPLTLIKGPVDNLLERADELPAFKEDLATMERNTARLLALVTQILDFRQTETKGFSLDFESVNFSKLVTDSYENFHPLARKRQLEYEISLPPGNLNIQADEDALEKIISNLLSNAVKYADKKIKVTLSPLKKEDNELVLAIENDGPAIPLSMREKIFEPFFRLKENTKQKGTGLGLALARSLAELHQGSLQLTSNGEGLNEFQLRLPIKHVTTS